MAEAPAPVRITVVTVGYNAARDLPLTLESIVGQDHSDLEIIVRDGASWDDSGAVLHRYADHLGTILSSEDAGVYHAMNHALDQATGDYVIFMNAGDRFHRQDAISRMVAALEDVPDIFYGDHVYVDRRIELIKRSAPFDQIAGLLDAGTIDHRWHGSIPGHQATFVRLDVLRRLRFDTRLMIGADHDLLFRAWRSGATMQYIDEVVALYAGGGMSATMADRCRIENTSIYRRFSSDPEAVDRLFYPGGSPFGPLRPDLRELPLGSILSFKEAPVELARRLGAGWSAPEPGHAWSIGPVSELQVHAVRGARVVRLAMTGNPHIAGKVQQVTVMVNSVPVPGIALPADGTTVLEIACVAPPWREGEPNTIVLMPDATACCEGDSRDMGLCLSHIEIV